MIDRVRERLGRAGNQRPTARRVSRSQREAAQRRALIIGVSVVSVLVVGILAAGAIYQYILLPGQTLAAVNSTEIDRSDYWKVRKLDLLNQIAQYEQLVQFTSGDQAAQYRQLATQARAQLDSVESDPTDPTTLNRMVEDLLVVENLDEFGIEITDDDINEFVIQNFAPAPIGTPSPTLGIDPTAEAWATATAEAQPTPTPIPSPTPETTAETTPDASGTPDADATPGATTPAEEGTPSAEATEVPTPTPMAEEDARATAEADYDRYSDEVLDLAGMSQGDFERLVARPQLARQRVAFELQSGIPLRAEQIHAAHILVATEEAANVIANDTLQQTDFADVARQQSADSATAVNGGDLGWFPRGVMVEPFEEVAFSLQPGEVSEPVQTTFGWHIITVLEREEDRPISLETMQTLRTSILNKWLDEKRAEADIDWNIEAQPPTQPTSETFSAPPDAPPTPTPTPTPAPEPTEEPDEGTPASTP